MKTMRTVPVSEVSLDQMQAVFSEEIVSWREQLHWNYRPALDLIERFLASRNLPGFALLNSGDESVVGYCYFVIDRPVGFIGNLYVLNRYADQGNYQQLLRQTVYSLREISHVRRIECQVFPFNCDLLPLFERHGFEAWKRYFLTVSLKKLHLEATECSSSSFRIQYWEPHLLEGAAEAIYDSYQESQDAALCRDYQTREGCLRFLKNLIENPACGKFSPDTTLVALDVSGRVCGVLLTSRIQEDTGMIPQISIRRESQGKGLGSLLLKFYLQIARESDLKRVTLSVSHDNQRAFRLYRRLGFEVSKSFHAFIWSPPNGSSL